MAEVEVLEYVKDGEKLVALAAKRTISKKPAKMIELSDDEVEKWIVETIRRHYWSPWEFSWYVFEVNCSRVCTHQLVRHRIASYAQLSQRRGPGTLKEFLEQVVTVTGPTCPKNDYMCYALAVERFYEKLEGAKGNRVEEDKLLELVEKAFHVPYSVKMNREVYREYVHHLLNTTKVYLVLLNSGIPFEDARYVLPQATESRVVVAMNARELVTSFLPLRMCAKAQSEVREVAWKLWRALVRIHPKLFMYAGPRCVLMENAVREKPVPLEDVLDLKKKVELTIPRCPELVPGRSIRACILNAIPLSL